MSKSKISYSEEPNIEILSSCLFSGLIKPVLDALIEQKYRIKRNIKEKKFRFTKESLIFLNMLLKEHLKRIMEDGILITKFNKRKVARKEDFLLAKRIRGEAV